MKKTNRFLSLWIISLSIIMASMHSIQAASYLMITDLGASAEIIRRGNIEGFSSGAASIFENPAGLYRVNHISTSVFASELMNEVTYRNVALAINTSFGVIGIGYMDAGVDDLIVTRLEGEGSNASVVADGVFSYMNRVIKVGYQRSFTNTFHLGVNVSGYLNEIHSYTGTGYSADAGVIYQLGLLEMSLFARNIIPMKVKYTDAKDPRYVGEEDLPLQGVFSMAYPFGDLSVMGQYKYDGVNTLMSAGLEYSPGFLFNMLTLSAGYKEFSVLEKVSNTFSLGAGLKVFGLFIDYAYEKSDHFEYDANNFASVGFNF